jgi:hypothetical protein
MQGQHSGVSYERVRVRVTSLSGNICFIIKVGSAPCSTTETERAAHSNLAK